jgi:hypothetical protein
MEHYKGIVVAMERLGSHTQVKVAGEQPGAFILANCVLAGLLDMLGSEWVGRPIEYEDGYLRFLDEATDQ